MLGPEKCDTWHGQYNYYQLLHIILIVMIVIVRLRESQIIIVIMIWLSRGVFHSNTGANNYYGIDFEI